MQMQDPSTFQPEDSSVGILPELMGILPGTEAPGGEVLEAPGIHVEAVHQGFEGAVFETQAAAPAYLAAPGPAEEPFPSTATNGSMMDQGDWDSPAQSPRDPVVVGEGHGDEENSWDGSDAEGGPKKF
eukprot:gnl/MRDRNA2_/MRDRNA2_50993_c0_seq1.p1 gnl/MRDRNA2_/MRDRNA2_50993_c0~~gnl/MRDRNA2_/MRDRNA2_50993_c0_seq1.p1  ORF type:complete len:128 (-),score=31.32 gnl/MRDRNA2_/MRDRNA2_50993_c0_seq1:27-410(-)